MDGAVTVNGRLVTELGARADPIADDIKVSGRKIDGPSTRVYLALYKPAGYVTTASDEYGRATVLDLLKDLAVRVFPVGRLDRNSEGLLLLTNDGDLALRLTHPRYGIEKEYHVLVKPNADAATIERLAHGVMLEGRRTQPAEVERLAPADDGAWLTMTIHEGRKRQIRGMCEVVGLEVQQLIRQRMGPIRLDDLQPGRYRALSQKEITLIKASVGLAAPPKPRAPRKRKGPTKANPRGRQH